MYSASKPRPLKSNINTTKLIMYDAGTFKSITFITRRNTAPIKIAIMLVSPIVPAVRPITISNTFTPSPALIAASGVAPVYASQSKFVIMDVNEISRKQRAPSAGFMKFCPNPPKSIFTTIIANAPPITPIQSGALGGRFSASKSPVTTAEKSAIVTFFFIPLSNMYSAKTVVRTVTSTSKSA